jgi:DNA-binding MarR family transcriptional regulator
MFTPSFLDELVARAGAEQPEGDRACETLLQFLAVSLAVRERLRHALAEHGCTEFGFEVLTTLRDAEGGQLPPSVIAERCGILRGTLTDVLARLEACGLVARHRNDTDRRQLLAELTPRGRQHCERIIEHYVRAMLDLAGAVARDARPAMAAALASLSRAAAKPAFPSHP